MFRSFNERNPVCNGLRNEKKESMDLGNSLCFLFVCRNKSSNNSQVRKY